MKFLTVGTLATSFILSRAKELEKQYEHYEDNNESQKAQETSKKLERLLAGLVLVNVALYIGWKQSHR